MFRIRRIFDDHTTGNRQIISQVQSIMASQFVGISQEEIEKLPEQLSNPVKYLFRSILFIADDEKSKVKGFALVHHAPDLHFCFLDFISAASHRTGRGIGGALYENIREFAIEQQVIGLFFECLPDDPDTCHNEEYKYRLRYTRIREGYLSAVSGI
jgi:GNAT superfamily N-acetyltransferase